MKSVAYDNAFQLQICDKFPSFVPPPKKPKKPKDMCTGGKKQKQNPNQKTENGKNPSDSSTRPSAGGKKRKRLETPESESEEDTKHWASNPNFSDIEKSDESRRYKNRGTISRPIIL